MAIAVKELKKNARAIGGIISELLSQEADSMSREEYLAKCAMWLMILRIQQREKGANK